MINRLKPGTRWQPIRKSANNIVPLTAEKIASNSLVEAYLRQRYRTYLERHKGSLPTLSDTDQLILRDLQESGIHITSLSALDIPGSFQLRDQGYFLFEKLAEQALSHKRKFQVVPDFEMLLTHAYIFQWGLCDRLVDIANNYIGSPVAYDTCLCNLSINNGLETATRRWHLDNEDRKVLKVLIYFNDVDEEGGPFQYFDSILTAQVLDVVKDRCQFLHTSQLAQMLPQTSTTQAKACTGEAGTVIFVDTAKLYHRGKPPTARSRRAITFGYCSRRPLRPFRCGRNLLSHAQRSQLAKGLSVEKQTYVHWEKTLPPWIRSLPKHSY
ncbi:MAG: hypothetical protein WBC73_06465 [Phormidesmis sp.]